MIYPDIYEVILEPCCKQQLKAIQRCTAAFKFADKVLMLGSFINIFIGGSGRGGSIGAMTSMSSTEWSILAQAMQSFPNIQKNAVFNMAFLHKLDHENAKGSNGHKLRQFWTATTEIFR